MLNTSLQWETVANATQIAIREPGRVFKDDWFKRAQKAKLFSSLFCSDLELQNGYAYGASRTGVGSNPGR